MNIKKCVLIIALMLLAACNEADTKSEQVTQVLADLEVRIKECDVLEEEAVTGRADLSISRNSLHVGLWYFHTKNSDACLGVNKTQLLALSKDIMESEDSSMITRTMAQALIDIVTPQGAGLGLTEAKLKFDALSDSDKNELLQLSLVNRPFNVITASQYYKVIE